MRALAISLCLAACAARTPVRPPAMRDVVIDTEEAEAVLAGDWDRISRSRGYRRLAEREASMGRSFSDEDFRAFLGGLGPRKPALRDTLDRWKQIDVADAAARALAYLPAGTRLRATVYLVIKPKENSFVFDVYGDPAIFLYVDPQVTPAKLENTIAHELHHIGFAAACPVPEPQWLGAFGEGVAMLAAAGGPHIHPHAVSPPAERARWDQDLAQADADLPRVEAFLTAVLDGKLSEAEENEQGMAFFGVQGPWYTLGWKMAVAIEEAEGRPALVSALCDPRQLLFAYNRVSTGARWSDALLERLRAK